MVYLNNIPQPTDDPATQSQAQFLENFAQLDSQFGTAGDHVALTAVSDNGLHKQVRLNGIIADPGLADPRASLYLKTVSGNSELFFENFNVAGAANVQRQMTNLTATLAGGLRTISTPWGYKMTFGSVVVNTAATAVTFPVAFTTTCYSLVISIGNSTTASQQAVFSNLSNTGFTGYGSNNGLLVYIYAIGD